MQRADERIAAMASEKWDGLSASYKRWLKAKGVLEADYVAGQVEKMTRKGVGNIYEAPTVDVTIGESLTTAADFIADGFRRARTKHGCGGAVWRETLDGDDGKVFHEVCGACGAGALRKRGRKS